MTEFLSLHGRRLGIGPDGQLVTNSSSAGSVDITQPAVSATITVSAEAATTANTRDCVVTLLNAEGSAIDYVEEVEVHIFLNAARTAYVVTGGSTGISLGAAGNGALLAIVAKKVFVCTTEATGILDLDWLDTGTEVAFIGVKLPSGRYVMSSALTNT
jgi:hypothetical protein